MAENDGTVLENDAGALPDQRWEGPLEDRLRAPPTQPSPPDQVPASRVADRAALQIEDVGRTVPIGHSANRCEFPSKGFAVNIPRQSRGLPLKAADGAADAAPDRVGHLKVAISATDSSAPDVCPLLPVS